VSWCCWVYDDFGEIELLSDMDGVKDKRLNEEEVVTVGEDISLFSFLIKWRKNTGWRFKCRPLDSR
jgi:hypothetical protein